MSKKNTHRNLHEENRLAWNTATDAHNSHKVNQAAYLQAGGHTLFPEEIELLGEISGLKIAHLQCNSGQDTLSLVQRGAVVTGIDISDTAIAFAQQLSIESGIPAEFVRSDIYDWLEEPGKQDNQYDVVFSSYGAILWLSDLDTWAKGIHTILKPGGRFVLVEFHPLFNVLEDDWTIKYDYFHLRDHITWEDGIGDYVSVSGEALAPSGYQKGIEDFKNLHPAHEFTWSIADLLSALIQADLTITTFKEYPYTNGAKLRNNMQEMPGHRIYPPAGFPSLPLMYGLIATKK